MRRPPFKGLCDSCASVSQVGELACRSWVVSIVLDPATEGSTRLRALDQCHRYVQLSGRGLRLVQQQCLITCCTSLLCSSLCWLISKFSSGLVTLVQKFGGSSCAGVETISLLSCCEVCVSPEVAWEVFFAFWQKHQYSVVWLCLLWLWFGISRTTHPPLLRQTLNSTFYILCLIFKVHFISWSSVLVSWLSSHWLFTQKHRL